jgi:hypothetical protein
VTPGVTATGQERAWGNTTGVTGVTPGVIATGQERTWSNRFLETRRSNVSFACAEVQKSCQPFWRIRELLLPMLLRCQGLQDYLFMPLSYTVVGLGLYPCPPVS